MAKTFAAVLLPAVLALCVPSFAHAADCTPDQADKLFHPYGEPSPCAVDPSATTPASKEEEKPNIFADDRGPKLYTLGVSGVEGGATIGGLGGFIWLISEFLEGSRDPNSSGARAKQITNLAGLSIAAVGGALFLTGGALLIADYATKPIPTLTPDGKGVQVTMAFRW